MIMKKTAALIAGAVSLFMSVSALAAPTVNINGEAMTFETEPYIKNGITMVPLRGIFEKLGARVTWDQSNLTVISAKDDRFVVLQIGNENAFVNSEKKELEQPAEVINDTTMVPLRFISEALGAKVSWDKETLTVDITQ